MPGGSALLDDFTGADETPIATNWSGPIYSGTGEMRRLSNQLAGQAAAAHSTGYYDIATFGPDCEVYGTYAAFLNNNNYINLYARIANPNSGSLNGYQLEVLYLSGSADTWKLSSIVAGTVTQLGATMTQDVTAGDSCLLECIGDQISAYYKSGGGGWTLIGTRTDSSVTAAGYLGAALFGNTPSMRLDDFSGGTLTSTPGPALQVVRSSLRW
jgi:hypothetical protein